MSEKYKPKSESEKIEYLMATDARRDSHYLALNAKIDELTASQRQMIDLIAGTNLNGNKGMVKLLETVETKVDVNREDVRDLKKDIDNVKFWGRGASGILFTTIIIIINYIKDKA